MRILVTNDDGIDSIGLHVLARRLTALGDVVVAAPDREYSGAGAALGTLHLMQPEVHQVDLPGVPEAWSVTGPPALCVLFSRFGVFGGPIDIVVSGINPGANTGRAIYHSGTVGAALTARNGGTTGVAVSQAVDGFGVDGQAWDEMITDQRWEVAAEVAAAVVPVAAASPEPVVLNVNVPNLPLAELRGWRDTTVATLPPRTMSVASLQPKPGHDRTFTIDMGWGELNDMPEDSDSGAVERGYVAVTNLTRLAQAPGLDGMDAALGDLGVARQ